MGGASAIPHHNSLQHQNCQILGGKDSSASTATMVTAAQKAAIKDSWSGVDLQAAGNAFYHQ